MINISEIQINMEMKDRSNEGSTTDSETAMKESVTTCDSGLGSMSLSSISIDIENTKNSEINSTCNAFVKDPKGRSSMKSSPVSSRSSKISIASIGENIESSEIDSDSDIENIPTNGEFIIQKLGRHVNDPDHKGVIIVSQNGQVNPTGSNNGLAAPSKPQIGSIAVQNSTDITFGDKTFYQGPVTIKQFLLDNNKWKPKDSNGTVNPAFDEPASENKANEYPQNKSPLNLVQKIKFNKKAVIIMSISILLTIVVLASIFIILIETKSKSINHRLGDGDDSRKNSPINSTIGDDNIGGGTVLRIISRSEWLAQPPSEPINDLELPATKVIIAHTATEDCTNQAVCTFRVRVMQNFHIDSRKWSDISYNFMVGGDGAAYEGRGWDKEGAHTLGFNKRSICIAFIGTYNTVLPPQKQLNAAKLLIEEGLKLHKISPDYKLFGHRQLIGTESPGAELYKQIQTWPHWSNEFEKKNTNVSSILQ